MNGLTFEDYFNNDDNNDKELDLDRIIDDYTPYVKAVITNMVNDKYLSKEDKEEILSDTFFVLWKNKDNKILKLDSYIAGITRNLVKEKLKKHKTSYDITEYENVLDSNDDIEMYVANREEVNRILKAIENLNYIDYEIITMFYYSSKSIKDIAESLNLSVTNVKSKLSRLRKKIKEELDKEELNKEGGNYGSK